MNVEIGTEAAQSPEKEYINGIFVAVYKACRWILVFLGGLTTKRARVEYSVLKGEKRGTYQYLLCMDGNWREER